MQIVVDEETTGHGSKILVEKGYTADGVIICDGTWSNRLIYSHLGHISLSVQIAGLPVASCVENRGLNPIYTGMKFIQRLKGFIKQLNDKKYVFEGIRNPYFLNVGSFHSGVSFGAVPANAKIEIQIGFSDKYSSNAILKKVIKIAEDVSDRIKIKKTLLKTEASRGNKNNLLIKKLKLTIQSNYNEEVEIRAVKGYSDMKHFPTKNICLYGPGEGKNAHSIDEQYSLGKMPEVVYNMLIFILDWCNEAK